MRDDLSNKLVHLTKGVEGATEPPRAQAVSILEKILTEKRLLGGSGFIKGGDANTCVCFSEAPIGKLVHLLAANDHRAFKYQPYGVLVDKQWIFEKGGRPVIYGPDSDFEMLPPAFQYRHVRFWLGGEYTVDHTWEREWRLKTTSLPISPKDVSVVLPDRVARDAFVEHFNGEDWHYVVLSDLGVTVEAL